MHVHNHNHEKMTPIRLFSMPSTASVFQDLRQMPVTGPLVRNKSLQMLLLISKQSMGFILSCYSIRSWVRWIVLQVYSYTGATVICPGCAESTCRLADLYFSLLSHWHWHRYTAGPRVLIWNKTYIYLINLYLNNNKKRARFRSKINTHLCLKSSTEQVKLFSYLQAWPNHTACKMQLLTFAREENFEQHFPPSYIRA
jgi:hypothetical protein